LREYKAGIHHHAKRLFGAVEWGDGVTSELFGARECGSSVGVLFGAHRRKAWSVRTSVEAGMSWISRVAFFGSKREKEGSEKASKRSLSVGETNRELFREPAAGGTGADEVAVSCEQRGLAEYSISGQRS
jgi:hypothetical protein